MLILRFEMKMSIDLWKSVRQSQRNALNVYIKPKQRFLTDKKPLCFSHLRTYCDLITVTNIWEVKSWTTCTDVGWCQTCYSFKLVTDACIWRVKDAIHSGFVSQFKMAALKMVCYANSMLTGPDWLAWQLYGFQRFITTEWRQCWRKSWGWRQNVICIAYIHIDLIHHTPFKYSSL